MSWDWNWEMALWLLVLALADARGAGATAIDNGLIGTSPLCSLQFYCIIQVRKTGPLSSSKTMLSRNW